MCARSNQKPWPMKWIVLVILTFVIGYTAVMLLYRKPGQAYRPFQDGRERETASRLQTAGYVRITATAERPADLGRGAPALEGRRAEVHPMPGGLPVGLRETLLDQPHLPDAFPQVRAGAEANQLMAYDVEFTCSLPDNKQLLSGATVYVREQEIAIVPDFEAMEGELLARTRESPVRLSIPAGTLSPNQYRVTLVGTRESKQWDLQVH